MNTPFISLRAWLCCVLLAMPVLASANSPAPKTYQVVSGDTLDQVIRKTMPNSPLRTDILRNAFIQQNPQAFTKSPPRALMTGVVLNIPNHDDLLRSHMVPGNAPGNSGAHRGGGYSTADMNMNERKNWVRFP